jgi:hypothetical protein
MMINIFIDPTILAFPPKEEDKEKDITNIYKFYENISLIYEYTETPNKKPEIAFFKEKGLYDQAAFLKFVYSPEFKGKFQEQNKRIMDIPTSRHFDDLPHGPQEILRNLSRIFGWVRVGYDDWEKRDKGIRAIEFEMKNTEEIDKSDKSENTEKEHYLQWPFFQNEHKKLFRYAKEIGDQYDLKKWNIYTRGSKYSDLEDEFINAKELNKLDKNHNKHSDTLKSAFCEAEKKFSSELIFSEDIRTQQDSIFDNPIYDTDFVPDRLFYYLQALATAVKYIKEKENDITSIKSLDDKELNAIVKKFGCDSVLDSMDYEEKKCCYRRWQVNGESDPNPFRLHLRPLTKVETGKTRLTMRIYCKWNSVQKKMAVMILKHPPRCTAWECDKYKECYPST